MQDYIKSQRPSDAERIGLCLAPSCTAVPRGGGGGGRGFPLRIQRYTFLPCAFWTDQQAWLFARWQLRKFYDTNIPSSKLWVRWKFDVKFQVEWLPDMVRAERAYADLESGKEQTELRGWLSSQTRSTHRVLVHWSVGPTDISTQGCTKWFHISQLKEVRKGECVIVTFLAGDNFSLLLQAQIIELVGVPVF